ncbi:MAG: hypothetical protein M1823_008987, partial [Watsoniomyces obsoletus]
MCGEIEHHRGVIPADHRLLGIDEEAVEELAQHRLFASGIATNYGSSILVSKSTDSPATHGDVSDEAYVKNKARSAKQSLATGIKIGMRMPSFK